MEDIKPIVAENLAKLRKSQGLTQVQLAEKFNYSDKAVCRWERGETLPDINVLYSLCEFYGITMNDLVSAELETEEIDVDRKSRFKYRILISILLVSVVWLAAT
ncbi:MAG: helix-turn-helix transcriptional regulator, partial [Clostridia bacterium]|nr:helix-turn-helix transcriptional regulator [Clostridia bacterium]